MIDDARARAETILLANGSDLGLLGGGGGAYRQVWARDSMICGLALLLLDAREVARNQRHALLAGAVVIAPVQQRLEAVVRFYDEQIASLEAEIAASLPQEGAWAVNLGLLLTIKGIGVWTALWLLVATVNFTSCQTVEQAVGYAVLGPTKHESGTSVRGREHLPRGGHARLHTALSMATLSAARHNPQIAPFYARLLAAGKPKKVARCAAARCRAC